MGDSPYQMVQDIFHQQYFQGNPSRIDPYILASSLISPPCLEDHPMIVSG